MKFLVVLFCAVSTSISSYSEDGIFTTTETPEIEDTTIVDNRLLFHRPKPFQHKPLFHNTLDYQFPSCTVAIYHEGKHICSGVLWSDWLVITTADCVSGLVDSSGIHIALGGYQTSIHKVSIVRYHRNYNSDPEAYNVAVLKTCIPVVKPKTNCVIAVSTDRNYCDNLPANLRSEPFGQREDVKFDLVPKGTGSVCTSTTRNSCCLKQTGTSTDCDWDQGGPLLSAETNVHGLITSSPENNCNKDLVKILGFTEDILYWIKKFSSTFKVTRCMKFFRGSPIEPF